MRSHNPLIISHHYPQRSQGPDWQWKSTWHFWGGFPPARADNTYQECCDGSHPVHFWWSLLAIWATAFPVNRLRYVHMGDVCELQVAPEGSQRSQREAAEELLRGWHHLILMRRRLAHHKSGRHTLKCILACVCGDGHVCGRWSWCHCLPPPKPQSPVHPPKRGAKSFCSYFCPAACLSHDFLLSKHNFPAKSGSGLQSNWPFQKKIKNSQSDNL